MIATVAPEPSDAPEPPLPPAAAGGPAPAPGAAGEPPLPPAAQPAPAAEPSRSPGRAEPSPQSKRAARSPRRRLIESDAWPGAILLWFVTVAAAVTLFAVGVPIDATVYGVPVAAAFGVALLQAGSLPLSLRWPWAAVVAFLAGQVLFGLLGGASAGAPWPVAVPQMVTASMLVGLIAWQARDLAAIVLWAGAIVVPLGASFLPDRGATPDGVVANLVTSASVTAVVLGLGRAVAVTRRRFAAAIDEERRVGAAEHERRLVAEERTRIARELHDVVAHRMSIIQVQATSAPYRLPDLDPAAAAEFEELAATARAAMAEMRELLTVLRTSDAEAETSPQPGFAELPTLIASVERAGLPVTAHLEDRLRGELVGQIAYRIVQEALSNVLRHAPGATATVDVHRERGAVIVDVENTPPDASSSRPGDGGDADRGHGLRGMRERARLVAGALEAGPTDAGGFRVYAVLPAVHSIGAADAPVESPAEPTAEPTAEAGETP
ncbi:sensor histidine kinase [Agromyces larvae]|uniref:histidine kinase n=1 Tax=Agromyces larvae TaxID=2929802 RepID=A0ABY4BY32_9MICO|nr:histidine kinase [Agromyces larvae]UOE44029.1 histidine kinase [Agromyces larvae]